MIYGILNENVFWTKNDFLFESEHIKKEQAQAMIYQIEIDKMYQKICLTWHKNTKKLRAHNFLDFQIKRIVI